MLPSSFNSSLIFNYLNNNNNYLLFGQQYLNNNNNSTNNLLQNLLKNLNYQIILDQQKQKLNETIKYLLQKQEIIKIKKEEEINIYKKDFEEIKIVKNEEIKKELKKEENKKRKLIIKIKENKNNKKRKRKRQEIETDSPVSGMFIKAFCDEEDLLKTAKAAELQLDDSATFVNVSENTKKAISLIPNIIGDSKCALCKIRFDDIFRLAMHKCPRIQHEEYKCRECEKVFSCPANLASHKRWHRPKLEEKNQKIEKSKENLNNLNNESKIINQKELITFGGLRENLKEAANALINLGLSK